ncbi:hypothetical protein OPS25_10785 [Alteromonas ponticola]|uniref:Uncharacterized protein n=1 Tax=Alteromonas aquimaris TaxID=2998417 RepID=A0ABT3P8C5_9ALTE|nr:hypothetical protein [Alteromonas aquimaris]MCW8108979.1 hypothetical protein [Alteromonas aquimaris]
MKILIRAINSQRKLKPYFYSRSAKVGGVGCLLGFVVAYPVFFAIAAFFGVDSNTPLRQYDTGTILLLFSLCIFTLALSLYFFCALSSFVYYGIKYKKKVISKNEFFNIVFKGLYPERWQRG